MNIVNLILFPEIGYEAYFQLIYSISRYLNFFNDLKPLKLLSDYNIAFSE